MTASPDEKASTPPVAATTASLTAEQPRCPTSGHRMVVSDGQGHYAFFSCNACRRHGSGRRWFCAACRDDFCLRCRPETAKVRPSVAEYLYFRLIDALCLQVGPSKVDNGVMSDASKDKLLDRITEVLSKCLLRVFSTMPS